MKKITLFIALLVSITSFAQNVVIAKVSKPTIVSPTNEKSLQDWYQQARDAHQLIEAYKLSMGSNFDACLNNTSEISSSQDCIDLRTALSNFVTAMKAIMQTERLSDACTVCYAGADIYHASCAYNCNWGQLWAECQHCNYSYHQLIKSCNQQNHCWSAIFGN